MKKLKDTYRIHYIQIFLTEIFRNVTNIQAMMKKCITKSCRKNCHAVHIGFMNFFA